MTATAHQSQNSGQVELYSKAIVAYLLHFVVTRQRDWDLFVQPLSYAYDTQIHCYINTTPFSLALTKNPPEPPASDILSAFATDAYYATDTQI